MLQLIKVWDAGSAKHDPALFVHPAVTAAANPYSNPLFRHRGIAVVHLG